MEQQYPEAAAIAEKMKESAQAHPWVPLGPAPQDRYHHFPNGLSLCVTVDIMSAEYQAMVAKILRMGPSPVKGSEAKYWHLSICRFGEEKPSPEEVVFWRNTFFKKKPDIEMPVEMAQVNGINSHHFLWRVK